MATLSGVFVGMGEVLGGILFGFMGHLTIKHGRDPIVILGFILSMVAYFLIFINIPPNAPLGETELWQIGYISPNKTLAIFTSFLLGFSDACFNTQVSRICTIHIPDGGLLQVYSILGGTFHDQPASAFGIFKFAQSLASGIGFFYSSFMELHWQLLVVVCFDILGTLACVKLEMDSRV